MLPVVWRLARLVFQIHPLVKAPKCLMPGREFVNQRGPVASTLHIYANSAFGGDSWPIDIAGTVVTARRRARASSWRLRLTSSKYPACVPSATGVRIPVLSMSMQPLIGMVQALLTRELAGPRAHVLDQLLRGNRVRGWYAAVQA